MEEAALVRAALGDQEMQVRMKIDPGEKPQETGQHLR